MSADCSSATDKHRLAASLLCCCALRSVFKMYCAIRDMTSMFAFQRGLNSRNDRMHSAHYVSSSSTAVLSQLPALRTLRPCKGLHFGTRTMLLKM